MKRTTLWKGVLAAVMAVSMIGQTALAQNVNSEGEVQEEVAQAEVRVTGIRMEGNTYNSSWTTGDVYCNDNGVIGNVVQGMNLTVSYSDGSESKIADSVIEWTEKGVKVSIKDKSSGAEIPMDNKILKPGTYEVYLGYQGFSCKATDFTVKAVEEAVDATITMESDTVSYGASTDVFRKTVTRFVADSPGYYTFRGVREGNPDWKFSIGLQNTDSQYVGSEYDTSMSKFLDAGTYYLKIKSGYAFTVSVEKKEMEIAGIKLTGTPYYDTWTIGDVSASAGSILVNVVQGMDLLQVYDDGTEVKIANSISELMNQGVTVTLKDQSTGSTVPLDDKRLPAGTYEVYLQYQKFECKAMEFTIQKAEEAFDKSIDLKENRADYEKDSRRFRKTVTKFVAASPGYYTIKAEVPGSPDAQFQMNLYNEDVSYQKSGYSAEPMQVFLKAGTYYVKIVNGDAHTVSVTGKELRSMDLNMEAPEETERLFLIDDIEKWRDVAGVQEENVNSVYNRTKVQLEYKDGTRETRRLSELIREWNFVDWGERIWNIMTGEPGGTTSDPLNVGIYELCYWSDTSETMTDENVDLDYNFIIYKGFQDVSLTDWFVYPVAYTSAAGMMTGMGDGTNFGPAENLSRAQFATILYRMEGSPEVDYKEVFPDVKDGEFYTDAVLWANENGIVTGYVDSGTFGPADHITREQMAVMMYRFAQYKKYDVKDSTELDSFPDHEKVSEFAEAAVKWASATGLIRGDQGNINPQGNASRAQCATIMMRFSEMYRD